MLMNTDFADTRPQMARQQFQADEAHVPDWRSMAAHPVADSVESEPFGELGDVSLAMRQFYQAPMRREG